MDRSLEEYRKKRDFGKTPEPAPGSPDADLDLPIFVIHRHEASRLHYDLRLQMQGVLKSFAIPRGFSYFPKDNAAFFEHDMTLVNWLCQFVPPGEGETFARGFLGRMLFSGEEATKKTTVLSGGACTMSRSLTGRPASVAVRPGHGV